MEVANLITVNISQLLSNQLFICWYSDTDNIVFPATNACLDGADNRLVSGFGHVCLAFAPVVVDTTLALLNES